MSQPYRIDWFDGSVTQDRATASTSYTTVEREPPRSLSPKDSKSEYDKKAIGFKKLYEISQLEPPILNLELEARPGFWLLFSSDISDDFIVLIVKTLKTLYKSLQKNESSRLLYFLETKFMESDFFDKLHDYVKKLPDVRLSQKSRNSQLWNDVNCFYSDLLEFYKGIFQFYRNRKEYLQKLNRLVEITDVSALGVVENHSESISENFYQNISLLQKDLRKTLSDMSYPSQTSPSASAKPTRTTTNSTSSTIKPASITTNSTSTTIKPASTTTNSTNTAIKPASTKTNSTGQTTKPASTTAKNYISEDFSDILDDGNKHIKDLSIVPNLSYLTLQFENSIKPNITDGAYASVEHYLDIQFKLLREDCYRTLKEGINQYRKHNTLKDCKDLSIRVYKSVYVTDIRIAMNRVGYVVDLSKCPDLEAYKDKKSFMHGSLLIFTPDNFNTMLSGTVITCLGNNNLVVEFVYNLPAFTDVYTMVESDVYFEPYHKVLKVLKQAAPPIPMQNYIVYVDKRILPPAYLNLNTTYAINGYQVGVLYPQWPTASQCGLDESQMDAFRFALTREFVVIQGPPGTGKTYLGTRIAGTLLNNISFYQSPMLVICSTNHALDQFLEGLLPYTNHLIRVGGQSKSQILQKYNLRDLQLPKKTQEGKTFGRLYYQKKKELDDILRQFKELALLTEVCRTCVLSYETISRYSTSPEASTESLRGFGQKVRRPITDDMWLRGLGIECATNSTTTNCCDLKIIFSKSEAENEIKRRGNEIQQMKSARYCSPAGLLAVRLAEERIKFLEEATVAFDRMMSWPHRDECVSKPLNIPMTEQERRWCEYFRMAYSVQRHLFSQKVLLYRKYLAKSREIEELRDTMDCEKLRGVKVVGMTTTMAAARRGLLEKLKPLVVIVEEAAEVLESHIVAALTDNCQHLILIGDHQQLRPNSAHYVIGKMYDLEVSLFERMVKNGVHSKTLTIQRRMRPEIRDLLVPTIYEKLDCHPHVLNYPDVRGMNKNLYFFDHKHFEKMEDNTSSYVNAFEAKWCLSLANMFVTLQYKPSEITIIATYSAQVTLIVKERKKYNQISDVHVTTVDNYQGEENRIVILSLVRSNAEKNVGFLGTPNRVCVALSRAREGLYIFGNMSCLETSSMWRSMRSKLQAQDAIGSEFHVIIQNDIHEVGTTDELDNICDKILQLQL